MPSTKNWWTGEIDWATPAGQLLEKFLAMLPKDRPFHLTFCIQKDIIEPAITRRKQGYGEPPPDYKRTLGQ